MEIIGYLSSIVIGISLGLIGGGGSILTVPVLVYLFMLDAEIATAYSLFIVGLTSAVGSIDYFRKNLVNVPTLIVFGIPSIIAVSFTRHYIVPAIPNEVFHIGSLVVTKRIFIMVIFAALMIAASYSMIKKNNKSVETDPNQPKKYNYPLILVEGLVVGMLTGLVGAGGGFLIIPALVILGKLPMKEAVGTSLAIIAVKSLIGFSAEGGDKTIDWTFLATISAFAILGIFIGTALSRKIDGNKLKPAFGYFVLVMGCYIIAKELFFS